jgi:hypothetical protein
MSLTFSDKKAENTIAYVTTKDKNKIISNLILSESEDYAEDVGLDDNHKFMIAPRPLKEKERSVLFVAGESGAGKSYFIKQYAMNYKKMFPKNPIFLISYLDRDETLDSYDEIKRIDCFTEEFLSECETIDIDNEFGDSFVIFDDIDSISNKKEKAIIYGLLNKMLRIGRHYNTSVAYLGHELYANHELKGILNESHSITFFPRFLNFKKLKYLLEEYFGLEKDKVAKIRALKDRNVTYIKGTDKVIVSDTRAFIL